MQKLPLSFISDKSEPIKDIRLLSTEGNAKALMGLNLPITRVVSKCIGFPEMMNYRLKTLHPKIYGRTIFFQGTSLRISTMHIAQELALKIFKYTA